MSAAEQFKAAVTSISGPVRDGTVALSAAAQGGVAGGWCCQKFSILYA